LESQSLAFSIAVGCHECHCKDRWIILRSATAVADFDNAVYGANTIRLDTANHRVVVLLHEVALAEVIRAAFGTKDEEAVEPRPIIHFPRVTAGRVANLGRTR